MQQTQETLVPSLGGDNPLEKEMATHSSVLVWKNPMDRGAWRAVVHRVANSRSQLSSCQQYINIYIINNI